MCVNLVLFDIIYNSYDEIWNNWHCRLCSKKTPKLH